MVQNMHLLSQLENMLSWKKSRKFYAEKLRISEKEVEDLLAEIRNRDVARNEAEVGTYIGALEERILEVNNDKGTLKSSIEIDFEPKSDEELAKLHKIDLNKYKISNYWSKMKSNGKFTSSVFATLKQPKDYTPEDFAKFLETYKPENLNVEKYNPFTDSEDVDVEISIADFHLAKRVVSGENSIHNRKEEFMRVLSNLMKKVAANYSVNTVVFPISNDFFHTDNYQNSTTSGTPQDVITTYDHEYEEGFDLLVSAIYCLKRYAEEVQVILVQGNHDRTKSFYLAHALDVYFEKDNTVFFDRRHSVTKHITLGETFIGYHHGNCKIEDLPLIFATNPESKQSFGNSRFQEVHTGDKHHYMAKEVKGVRIQQMPSLSGTDRWHLDNNYVNSIRAGLALVYHPEKGKISEYEERII